MEAALVSLTVIMLVAFLAPLLASLVPGRTIPEVVFLVFAGAILGPHLLGVIQTGSDAISILSELGLGFLFLLAGYEINPSDLRGPMGRHAALSWVVSFALALGVVWVMPGGEGFGGIAGLAFAIALTTTAYGTLAPIMRDRSLVGTPVGNVITAYGATGELLPVLAMAFLLSARSAVATAVILAVFIVLCVVLALMPKIAARAGSRALEFLRANVGAGSHPVVRATVLVLVLLIAVSGLFGLDVVLGAFAAGFIMRSTFPQGNEELEKRIEAMGYGFFIPVFFVVSGAGIDLHAAVASPLVLVGFIVLIALVRGVIVYLSLKVNPLTRAMTWREKFSCATYCSMALPLIVAVTSVAVTAGAMSSEMASVLVTAGAITVILVPFITALVRTAGAAHPVEAVREIAHHDAPLGEVIHSHQASFEAARRHFHDAERAVRASGQQLSSVDYLAAVDTRSGASMSMLYGPFDTPRRARGVGATGAAKDAAKDAATGAAKGAADGSAGSGADASASASDDASVEKPGARPDGEGRDA